VFKLLALIALESFVAIAGAAVGAPEANAQAAASGRKQEMSSPRGQREFVSLVVLSGTPIELDLDRLRAKLDELDPGAFLPPRDEGSFIIDGAVPGQFLIQSRIPGAAGIFLLHNIPVPYTEVSDFARSIGDRSLRRKAAAQCCFLSIDLLRRHTTSTNEDAYRFIRRALAKLAPADAAFIVDRARNVTIAFDEDVRRRLASGQHVP
jgi:hypothetical protein